ncbi:MAG: hypothetical protein HYX52_01395 [Chloroflexi bacterium]|nr:hypothetical protein [Chloroflexota bacterium]
MADTRGLVDEAELRALLALVQGTDLEELEVQHGGLKLHLRRDLSGVLVRASPSAGALEAAAEQAQSEWRLAVTSPLVGVFRTSIAEGSTVESGQALGSIEAMGLRTSVDAPRGGLVEQLLSQDGQPVEYGQPLLVLVREDA